MTEEANILQFPKHKIVRERLPDIEEINKLKEKGLQKFADAVSGEVAEHILEHLDSYGIDVENDVFIKDFYFTITILTASIYRSLNIEHPMHSYIDSRVCIETKDEDST